MAEPMTLPVMPALIRVTDDTTEAELLVSIGHLNDEAKRLSRQGKSAMLRPEYQANHARLDALCKELEAKRGAQGLR